MACSEGCWAIVLDTSSKALYLLSVSADLALLSPGILVTVAPQELSVEPLSTKSCSRAFAAPSFEGICSLYTQVAHDSLLLANELSEA